MNYRQQLAHNRNEDPVTPDWMLEWNTVKIDKYRYDPTYDYLFDIKYRYIAEADRDYGKGQGSAIYNAVFFCDETKSDKHKLAYNFWLDYKYQDFRRDWKPKDVDGLNYLFITFNFSPAVSISDIKLEMARIVNLAIFDRCKLTWCYEFYTGEGSHPHIHMLVELKHTGTLKVSELKQKVFQKKSLTEIMNINYKLSWAKEYKDRTKKRAVHLAYLSGMKAEEKQDNCERDKQWRIDNQLEEIYIKDKN